jgi:hypothetical protein
MMHHLYWFVIGELRMRSDYGDLYLVEYKGFGPLAHKSEDCALLATALLLGRLNFGRMAITPFILLNRSSVKRVWLVHVV